MMSAVALNIRALFLIWLRMILLVAEAYGLGGAKPSTSDV